MFEKLFSFKPPKEKTSTLINVNKILRNKLYGNVVFDEGPSVWEQANIFKKAPTKILFDDISKASTVRYALQASGITAWLPRPGNTASAIYVYYLDFGKNLASGEIDAIVAAYKAGELGPSLVDETGLKKETQISTRPMEEGEECDGNVCVTTMHPTMKVTGKMMEEKSIIHRTDFKEFEKIISQKGGVITTSTDVFPSKIKVSYVVPIEEPTKKQKLPTPEPIGEKENNIPEQEEAI